MDNEIAAVLAEFESRTMPFEALELSGRLRGLADRRRESGVPISTEISSEVFAWAVLPAYNCKEPGWGTYFGPMADWGNGCTMPNIADINTDTIDYWAGRSLEVSNPLLKLRYADVTWDFSGKLEYRRARGQVALILIDSVLTLAVQDQFPNEIEGYQSFKRALEIAVLLRDPKQLDRLGSGLIAYEDRHAEDCLPGTWGMSFDQLLRDGRKLNLAPEQEIKIIVDLEGRLTRLSDREDIAKLEPHHVEKAALRLATHFRRVNQRDDLRRVMGLYAGAFMRKAETNLWVGSAWLETVHRKLIEFQLHDEAKKFQPTLRAAAVKMRQAMPRHTYSMPVNTADLNAVIAAMLQGGWEEIFQRLIGGFLPRRARELEHLRASTNDNFIMSLSTSNKVDQVGRVTAKIGTLEHDPEGNLVHHYAKLVEWNEWILRCIVEALIAERGLSADQIASQIYESPVPDPSRRPIVQCALEAYIAKNWAVAIHLLVPQIEDTVRRLVDLNGGVTWREGKHEGLHVRNLDELLCDEFAVKSLGEDITLYLRMLLTDQRGMNVRNDVAHGIIPPEGFNSRIADRLVHAMLIFGSLRLVTQEIDEDAAPTTATAEVATSDSIEAVTT